MAIAHQVDIIIIILQHKINVKSQYNGLKSFVKFLTILCLEWLNFGGLVTVSHFEVVFEYLIFAISLIIYQHHTSKAAFFNQYLILFANQSKTVLIASDLMTSTYFLVVKRFGFLIWNFLFEGTSIREYIHFSKWWGSNFDWGSIGVYIESLTI